jgi:hypothetical protein
MIAWVYAGTHMEFWTGESEIELIVIVKLKIKAGVIEDRRRNQARSRWGVAQLANWVSSSTTDSPPWDGAIPQPGTDTWYLINCGATLVS